MSVLSVVGLHNTFVWTATESRPGPALSDLTPSSCLPPPASSLPGSILTLIPLRRSGLLSLSIWFTTPVGRPGKGVARGSNGRLLIWARRGFWFIVSWFCALALSWKSCVGSPCPYGRTTAACHTTTGSTLWRWHTVCTPFCRKPLGYSQS